MTDAPAAAGTSRTDKEVGTYGHGGDAGFVLATFARKLERELAEQQRVIDAQYAELSACRAELAALNAQFDAAELFTKYSRDSGETWQQWPLAKRVELAIRVCASQNDYEERYEQSERLLAAAAKDAERLDWIAMHHPEFADYGDRVEVKFIRNEAGDKSGYLAFTLREAIDAAILGDPK